MKENMWLGCVTFALARGRDSRNLPHVLSCIYLQDMHLNFHLGVKGGDERYAIADYRKAFHSTLNFGR